MDDSTSPKPRSGRETLQPELQHQILLQAATPEDLFSLIRASPRLYQVFLLDKRRILCRVARHQFHPAVLPEIFTLVSLSEIEHPLCREAVIKYCQNDFAEIRSWQETDLTISQSATLCRLGGNLRFFIKDYAQSTLPLAKAQIQSQDFHITACSGSEGAIRLSELSDSEAGRLQRAFCRFEIYRYLFVRHLRKPHRPASSSMWYSNFSAREQAICYLEKLPDFQIAEIHCVRDYLARRLYGIFQRLENRAVTLISPGRASGIHLYSISGKSFLCEHVEHLLSLGLPHLRRVYEARGDAQEALFMPGTDQHKKLKHSQSLFLSRALESVDPSISLEQRNIPDLLLSAEADHLDNLNTPAGWRWAYLPGLVYWPEGPHYKGLRDRGYVFWDYNRLLEIGILERNAVDVGKTAFQEKSLILEPSVEQRLLDKYKIKAQNRLAGGAAR
ncbi:hypothetical protein ACLMJK_009155 [Lecanora helva]